ncbi:MAG: redoxin domain-containing protein [Planctomycetes bacterium]|nr:redoxin domain-containing protein [Planctomycetota bacterium]
MISTCAVLALTWMVLGCENPQPPAKPATNSRPTASQPTESTLRASTAPVVEKPKAEPKVASQVAVVSDSPKVKTAAAPAKLKSTKPKPAGPPAMPQVLMSEKHRKACKVFVGDTLPEMELSDLAGKKRKLSAEYGKQLTVICLFGGKLPTEEQELMDLATEVVDRYGKEVAVIGVAVGQSSDSAAAHVKKLGVKFPVFTDTDRKAYDAVATDYLPRTYLVDPTGKILWLDMEYSASTRRQINDAIRHVLETKK